MAALNKMTWHWSAIPKATKQALDWCAGQNWLGRSGWYLAGGTALALQVGHRSSVDLDFFTTQSDFSAGKLTNHLPKEHWRSSAIKEGTIYGELYGAKISFIAYPFFKPQQPYVRYGSVRILSPDNIAVMKIVAISQRGRKRDFYDLYWYVKNREPLHNIMLRLGEQYPEIKHDYHHIIKSLVYFADAENDFEPKLYFTARWTEVKKFFKHEAASLAKSFL